MEYKAKKAYQDKIIVESYNSKRFKSLKGKITNWMELRLIDKALRYLQVLSPARILDLPCGTGRLTLRLLEMGHMVTGADISPEMVRHTNERIKEKGFEAKSVAKVENAENLSFSDNSFNGGICLRLLGHTPPENRLKIIQEFNRVCSDFLILVYYNKKSLKNILRGYGRRRRNIPWYPVDIAGIDLELGKLGLKKDKVIHLAYGFSETVMIIIKK